MIMNSKKSQQLPPERPAEDDLSQELELSTDAMMSRIAEEADRATRERQIEHTAPADVFGVRFTF